MSKIEKHENYLEKPSDKKEKIKEELILGNGPSLEEKKKLEKDYKEKMLNEG